MGHINTQTMTNFYNKVITDLAYRKTLFLRLGLAKLKRFEDLATMPDRDPRETKEAIDLYHEMKNVASLDDAIITDHSLQPLTNVSLSVKKFEILHRLVRIHAKNLIGSVIENHEWIRRRLDLDFPFLHI